MGRQQRIVRRRIIIQGQLVLQTPAHFGDGDSEGATDMALLRDGLDSDYVLLPGSSIAGALRNYIREYEHGFSKDELFVAAIDKKHYAEILFGGIKSNNEGYQSPLIVNDSLTKSTEYELRDGVRIDPGTRTASNKTKYDLELLAAGTVFPLKFELAIAEHVDEKGKRLFSDVQQAQYEQKLISALATALHGLAHGQISLGMRKRRGFGHCTVPEWQVWDFDLQNRTEHFQWLRFENPSYHVAARVNNDIRILFSEGHIIQDRREALRLEATFALKGSLLIRSGQDQAVLGPDIVHLHARQVDGQLRPVISGTSLAGVLRHRVERIANTLVPKSGSTVAAYMFGRVGASQHKDNDPGQASRIIVHEAIIQEPITDLVQNRISIDRFTGSTFDGALFNEQPVFAKPETHVTLTIDVFCSKQEANNAPDMASKQEIAAHESEGNPTQVTVPKQEAFVSQKLMSAMLLLLLKDLWTADLPIGGESSIGRGRLKGRSAIFGKGEKTLADLDHDHPGLLKAGDRKQLNTLIEELPTQIRALLNKEKQHEDA